MAIATILQTLLTFITIYATLLFVTVLLGWFPQIDWYKQPFAAMRQITDPYLNLFRGIIPPVGGLDLSCMLGFVILSLLQRVLAYAVISL